MIRFFLSLQYSDLIWIIPPLCRPFRAGRVGHVYPMGQVPSLVEIALSGLFADSGSDGINDKRQPISKLPLTVPYGFVAGAGLEPATFGL